MCEHDAADAMPRSSAAACKQCAVGIESPCSLGCEGADTWCCCGMLTHLEVAQPECEQAQYLHKANKRYPNFSMDETCCCGTVCSWDRPVWPHNSSSGRGTPSAHQAREQLCPAVEHHGDPGIEHQQRHHGQEGAQAGSKASFDECV